MFEKLFNWLVVIVNRALSTNLPRSFFIGILDQSSNACSHLGKNDKIGKPKPSKKECIPEPHFELYHYEYTRREHAQERPLQHSVPKAKMARFPIKKMYRIY